VVHTLMSSLTLYSFAKLNKCLEIKQQDVCGMNMSNGKRSSTPPFDGQFYDFIQLNISASFIVYLETFCRPLREFKWATCSTWTASFICLLQVVRSTDPVC
jgi:hypothetical protein